MLPPTCWLKGGIGIVKRAAMVAGGSCIALNWRLEVRMRVVMRGARGEVDGGLCVGPSLFESLASC